MINSLINDEELGRANKSAAETSSETQVRTEATNTTASTTKGALEYSIVRDHSNHFIHNDLMLYSKLT